MKETSHRPVIALVGDYSPEVFAHGCIPRAIALAAGMSGVPVPSWEWVGTELVQDGSRELDRFAGVWLVPGSPYRNMQGAIAAARFARQARRPFLGTCGGFQHAVIDFAREVAGIAGADHAETHPDGGELVVTRLSCSLVEQSGEIVFTSGSQLGELFLGRRTRESYRCNYGVNPVWQSRLETAGLRFTGHDLAGEVRAFELPGHPFFTGTLFQPERSAARNEPHPLIAAFVRNVTAS